MKVYHGTDIVIEKPQITNRFKTLDFGEGFYTTENENQAQEFAVKVCKRRNSSFSPVVNCYEFNEDLTRFSVLKFDAPDEKWLDFVVERRKGIPIIEKYDLIIGPVANDDVFGTIILYEAGQLDKESAIKRFKVKRLYNQVLFCNKSVLSHLTFIKSYKVGG
ncbi:DUF3990 domain-containing protein [Bacteroides sp. 519]|uniref:DUF3990 domain-containing protein n=1 Tax=Bacteroides sp. 519 TaxID=2302937 RepID=UPI0013D2C747|nr:DUF3990 domain-containing protein [Bacteroides sp. 519]NDV59516.1 DUF3990 domain-containing protein [Bacteroides sp. 519]